MYSTVGFVVAVSHLLLVRNMLVNILSVVMLYLWALTGLLGGGGWEEITCKGVLHETQ
jgi:hypothetical protein